MELEIFPSYSVDYAANTSGRQTHFCCNFRLGFALCDALSNFKNLGFSKARSMVTFPMGFSAFACRVVGVICMCTQKQMRWVAAWGIVALMKNQQSIRYRPIKYLPPNTGCQSAPIRSVFFAANAEKSVARGIARSNPQPALVGATLVYLFPESLLNRTRRIKIGSVALNKSDWLSFDVSRIFSRLSRYGRGLAASTMAVTWLNFIKGKFELLHKNTSCRMQRTRLSRASRCRQEAWNTISDYALFAQRLLALDTSILAQVSE